MRQKIVAGNWKMNTKPSEGVQLVKNLKSLQIAEDVKLIIAPPFTHLALVKAELTDSNIGLASQNLSKENFGAYTGEIAAEMLKELSVNYAIIGHSERRLYYGETDDIVAAKVLKALATDIKPIVCVGENLEERTSGNFLAIIKKQIEAALFGLSKDAIKHVVVAYEPVWAIGTGKTASPEQAQEVHAFIRSLLVEKFGKDLASDISILYGGSCKPSNAKELFEKEDIDGGLIGGAALKAEDFAAIANSFGA